MNVQGKLLLGAGTLALISIALTAGLIGQGAYSASRDSLQAEVQGKLAGLREEKKAQVEDYFATLTNSVQSLARSTTVIDAYKGMRVAHEKIVADTGGEANLAKYRAGLIDYYTKDFVQEFDKRNANKAPDMAAFVNGLDPISLAMQYQYVVANPNPLGKKEQLMVSPDASAYSKLHAQFHPSLEAAQKKFGYYDIFLIDPDTNRVIYTVFKELDFSSRLDNAAGGIAAKTGLAEAASKMVRAKNRDEFAVTDYAIYLASYNDEASFISAPIFDGDKQIGILAIQAPLDQVTGLMTSKKRWKEVGLGDTGETILVGSDKLLRSDSRSVIEQKDSAAKFAADENNKLTSEQKANVVKKGSVIGVVKVDSEGVNDALAGKTGVKNYKDYRGVDVVAAYGPVKVGGFTWVLVSKQDAAEVYKPIDDLAGGLARLAFGLALALLALAALATFFFVRGFMRPINRLQDTVKSIAGGDMTARAQIKSGDELQVLGGAFDNLLDDRLAALAKAERENDSLNNSVIELLQSVAQISERDLTVKAPVTEDIIGTVADSINQLTGETGKVLKDVTTIAALVEHASGRVKAQADAVSVTATTEREHVSRMVQQIQYATEAMQQISSLATSSNDVASAAMQTTQTAQTSVDSTVKGMSAIRDTIGEVEKRIKRLGERSQEISQIVSLINTISERTHVLSLNASMQAAVAGDAGRGFAVVAEEVQRLAENSRNATQQIANLVQNIQIETNDTINTVNKTIEQVVQGSDMAQRSGLQMRETQETTAKLVGMVRQIEASVQEQAKMVDQLRNGANEIGRSAQQTGEQIAAQNQITGSLVTASQRLVESVSVFKLPQNA